MKAKKFILTAFLLINVSILTGCKGDPTYPRTFTVNFVTGEGGEVIESQVVKEGYKVTGVSSPDHVKEHIFRGWYTDEAFTNYFDVENYRVFEDLTLYAKWTFPDNNPQEIRLADDAFTKTITWVQKGIAPTSTDVKVKAYKGQLAYSYEYNENYDKQVVSGTQVEYTSSELVDVEGTLSVNGEYEVSYTIDNPGKEYYWFVISSASGSFETSEVKDIQFKGEGTEENPYLVYSETDLKYLTTHSFDKNTYAEIKSDITIMSIYSEKEGCVYDGHLTGNKSNALIKTNENYVITLKNDSGLFHTLGENAQISDITLSGSLYGSRPSMGVLANYNYGHIEKINSKAVSMNSQGGVVNDIKTINQGGAGGIVGTNYGYITNCTVSSASDNVIQGHIAVGGIAGINYGTITEMDVDAIIGAYNGNEISLTINNSFAGTVVGVNYGTVSYIDVYNGKVNCRRLQEGKEGEGATNIGGVVGYNAQGGVVDNCLFDGMRCVGDTNVGGIVGYNDGTLTNCYTGRRLRKPSNTQILERQFISPIIGSYNVGGIAGKCGPNSVIKNVFSTANVWAYRNAPYTVAEKADNAIGVSQNQDPRLSSNYLGQKYGVVYTNTLSGPVGENVLVIDNSMMIDTKRNHALGYVFDEQGNYVKDMQLVKQYLTILGDKFGFRDSESHGIRLVWESSVVPLDELVIPE
ncbi:MAG: InlB B-repeat-containing protein [Bacilli bacterium]